MKLPKAWLPQLTVVVLADVLIGYLTVESLDSLTGAHYGLPVSSFLVNSLGLAPLAAGLILAAAVFSFGGVFVYWLWKHTPEFITRYIGMGRKAAKGAPQKAPNDGAMRVGDLQLSESAETKPFVDVVQLEGYPLNIYAAVTKEEGREGYTYAVIEPSLSEAEKARLVDLKKLLVDELDVDLRSIETPEKAEAYLSAKVRGLAKKYGYKIQPPAMTKLLYYLTRDFIHLGKIEPLMRDKLIEDISCDGAAIPIYIWYRDYESIPTNISFETEEELNTFVSKLAYSAGKHVSLAEPIVDASLADGSRLHLTYGKEITQKGSTFTIRKFRVDPLTIVDLIRYNTLSSEIAAYLWYLIEKKLALLIAGGTASGKSIPYDENVLVYEEGKQRLVPIGALFDEMATTGRSIKDGVYETVDCGNLQTASFDSNLKVRRFDVRSVVRHPAPDTIYSLRTRSGRTVRATGDHSVFTISGGRVVPFPTSEVTQGMFVAVPRSIPDSPSQSPKIDLLAILAKARRPLYVENVAGHVQSAVDRLGEQEVSRILGLRLRSVREGVRGGFLAARVDKFLDLTAAAGIPITAEGLWIRSKTNRNFKVAAELPMGKPLARFLGYWTAEGMYQEKGVSLFQLDPLTRTDMLDSAFAAFGLRGRANNGDRTRMDFNSSVVLAVLKGIYGEGSGAGSKRIPSLIFGQPNELIAEFLRGYFTGDASAGSVIEASTKSRELAYQLLYALSRFEIVARVSPKMVGGRKYYRVFIFGQQNLKKFEEKIGFLDRARQSKLREAVLVELQPHTNVDTIPGIAPLLKEALLFKHGKDRKEIWSDWHSYWSPAKRKSMGRQTLASFIRETGAQDAVEQTLSALAYSDIFWDEVVEVETVSYRGKHVYDLEVPGAQNFVGGLGGIFLHNTTSLNALSMFIAPGEKIVSVEDSVTADAEILVREGEGVRKVRIGTYVDEALQRGSATTEAGHELARPDGLQVLTSDDSGNTFWSTCTALIRHRVHKKFVKVTTRTGKTIEVTADHSLFSLDEKGGVTEVRAGDLRSGSFIAAPRSYPHENKKYEFELDSLPSFSEFSFKEAPSTGDNGNGVVVEHIRVHAKHSPLSIPAHVVLDEDLAFLAGLWVADGFYDERTVGFSAGEKDIGPRLQRTAGRLGLNVTRHSDGISLLLHSKPLRLFFESVLGLSGDDYSRHVPDLFFGADEAVVSSFLRGYFTGDGSVAASEIQVESASRQLLLDVQTLLLRFGITFSVGRTRKVGTLGGQGTFRGCVVGTSQVARFAEKVGFEQSGKMSKIFGRPKASKYYLDPIPLNSVLSYEIKAAKKGLTQDPLRQRLNKGIIRSVVSRQTLLELGRYKEAYRSTRGYALATSGFFFEEIVRVEKGTREERVYDLSVPRTGRFIANNVICHNTPEINIPHENWIQSVTRGVGTAGEITMFDLIKGSLRQRPDVLIVGEVRGEEAFTLFQSIATGHGGLATIHADSVEATINRLTTEPMNIPRSLVGTTLDCIVMQLKIRLADRSVRRVVAVTEVVGHDARTDEIVLNDAFKWDPVVDRFAFTGRSKLFDKITQKFGTRPEEIRRDIDGRRVFLDWLVAKNIRGHAEVSNQVREFYAGPYAVINKAKVELEGLKA